MVIQIELKDANELDLLTGNEIFPAQTEAGKPIQVSINQVLELVKSTPILSFRMITSGPLANEILITLSDDSTFQFTKI